MPTANRRFFVVQAVSYFLAQDYLEKELVIVDDGADSLADIAPNESSVHYFRFENPQSIGAKRNIAAQRATGEVLIHWDDDDWSAPWRLDYQVEQLLATGADICGLDRIWFYAPEEQRAWEYVYDHGSRPWVYGATLAYTRVFWEKHRFPEINVGEDARFVWADARAKIHVVPDSRFLVARIHPGNVSPKRTADARYQPRPVEEIKELLGDDFSSFTNPKDQSRITCALTESKSKPRALVSAALGIGDILRVTPLIRVVHRLGYETDVLLATDYADAVQLLEGAPEIRRLFHLPSPRRGAGPALIEGLTDQSYQMATFTTWSAPLRDRVQAKSVYLFERGRWLAEGDMRCVQQISRELGWQGELPQPFAMASNRKFDLPPGTIAIHPGCKYEWPWKKWHGFDELAGLFSSVVIVGTDEDLCTDNTYFQRSFAWPAHARSFAGKLGLRDTAALLRQCTALVSNDSGLMHLGVALGIPTFGIFGITSPQREMIGAPNMFPVTKGLSCEPACRKGAWGRRDCEFHLRCLKTLSPEEVFMQITATLSERSEKLLPAVSDPVRPRLNGHSAANETIKLAYHGYAFDASGYGHAARAYIHALHGAGVELSVVDLAGDRPRQVGDPLVASLIGRSIDADFHLFHGTPPQWARLAFPLRNVIAMTVWETDTMPTQWRPILTHALDVWLPCEFNTSVFSAALGKPVFKLSHPVFRPAADGDASGDPIDEWEIQAGDFVFYAIFEWQDRKSPERTMEAYFKAFPQDEKTALVLKTNPGAAAVAHRAVEDVRSRTGSRARAVVRAEGWSDTQIAALHARGDCYVSLHRGEGWGYPLFDAASLGKPVIATGYSGPLDYLAAGAHSLVRHTLAPVRQPYAYYRSSMNWAEPDTAHASELMREVRAKPEDARAAATTAAKVLVQDFSLEAIGQRAHRRLIELLRQTNNAKWERLDRTRRETQPLPPVPIPGEWFDADYFEHGAKSNWTNGYHWHDFAGLFHDTAQFLAAMFPEAESFLDAGCAKGFLVRALRELGKDAWGFDHSPWVLERAEDLARPFLKLGDTTRVEFDRPFDVLLAFSLFESLTESQAAEFFRRSRAWTRHGLVAVILLCDSEEAKSAVRETDGDLSHITLRNREWWHALALQTGWKQDALHRGLQRLCQKNPLPVRMGWQLFVYAPN
jgi:ADP-heptose:LPS heptosyltransferase